MLGSRFVFSCSFNSLRERLWPLRLFFLVLDHSYFGTHFFSICVVLAFDLFSSHDHNMPSVISIVRDRCPSQAEFTPCSSA